MNMRHAHAHFPALTALAIAGFLYLACGGGGNPVDSRPATPTLAITPAASVVAPGNTLGLTAQVSGTTSLQVVWAVDAVTGGNATVGTVTASGLSATYTAPGQAGGHTVTASAADAAVSASASITVQAPAQVAVSPTSASLSTGSALSITATVTGPANTAVTWTVDGIAGGSSATGTVTGSGATVTYAAPASAGSHTVVATSVADPSRSASTQVTVLAPAAGVAVVLSPSGTVPVASAGTLSLTASVSGSSNTAVTWTVDGGAGSAASGTLTGTGTTVTYTAPAAAGTHTVTATSAADTSRSASVLVTVLAPATVAVTLTPPGNAAVIASGTLSITASVTGSSNTAVTWTVDGVSGGSAAAGTLTGTGATVTYTAPAAAGTHTVTATSAADTSRSASVQVTVLAPATVAVTLTPPGNAAVAASGTLSITASVTGSSNTAVTWTVDGVSGGSAAAGTLAGTGATVTYTAPAAAGTHTVTATSAADTSKGASLAVTVAAPSAVAVSLSRVGPAFLPPSGSTLVTAAVTGSSNTSVTWSVDGVSGGNAAAGAILAPGAGTTAVFTAPSGTGVHTVTATSAADPTQSASLTFTVASTIIQASAIPVGANVRNAPYNAAGDGVTDDTAAIMAAVKTVAGTGKAVYVPAGTYLINPIANSGAGIRLGSDMTLLLDPDAVLQAMSTSTFDYEVVCVSSCHDVNITGGTINGNNGSNTIPTPTPNEGGDALEITGSRNVVVEGVIVQNGFADGLYVAGSSSNVTISNVTARANRRNGMSIVNASGINVINGDFSGNLGSVEVAGSPMVNGSGIDIEANANQHISNILVAGCTFTDNRYMGLGWGILFSTAPGSSTDGIFAVGNTATGNDRGLDVENCAGSVILNNRVSGSGSVGIFIHDGATATLCRGNVVGGTGSGGDASGIECYLDTGSVVDGNTSTGNTRYGILAANSASPTITNNSCPGNTLGGVYTYRCTDVTASGNTP